MTLDELRDKLLSVDPNVKPWKGVGGDSFTVYSPYKKITAEADGAGTEVGWKVQIDVFSKNPKDSKVSQIESLLEDEDDIAIEPLEVDYEEDTGYFHFIWDCEVAYG